MRLPIFLLSSIETKDPERLLFNFVIVFIETALVEYYELKLFTARHSNGCNRENHPFPAQLANFADRQYEIFVFSIHCQLVGLVCDGILVNINSTAQDAAGAY